MAGKSLGTLTVDLIARTSGFVQGMSKAERESAKRAKQIRKDLQQIGKEFKALGKSLAVGGVAAGAGLVAIIEKNRELIDEQAKLARSLESTVAGLAVTTRAGELSGVAFDKVAQATKDLTRRLSQAADGTGPAVKALERLNLTAEELSQLPLDERIQTINQAILDFIPAAQRASVAGQLFGEEGSLAISRLDPETIKKAREEAQLFGTTLSQLDAAKVEAANDAFSTIGLGLEGISKQITVEFAPIIEQLGNDFKDLAVEAGGFGFVATSVFESVVSVAAFTADAVDGVSRTFELLGKAAATAFVAIETGLAFLKLDFEAGVEGVLKLQAAFDDMDETLNRPLSGQKFRQYVDDAKAAGDELRKVLEAGGGSAGGEGVNAKLDADIAALRLKYGEEEDLLRQKYEKDISLLDDWIAKDASKTAEANELKFYAKSEFLDGQYQLEKKYNDMAEREAEARKQQRLQSLGELAGTLGSISTLMNSESKKMFEVGKVAAIAQATVSTAVGVMKAWELGPILGPILAPLVALAGAAQIAQIKKTKFQGGGGAPTAGVTNTQRINNIATPTAAGGGIGDRNIFLSGFGADDIFRGQTIIDLANSGVLDGGVVRTTQ